MSTTQTTESPSTWKPKAIIFDLFTALLDSWTLWAASTPQDSAADGRLWRARYLEITFGSGTYVPYEDLVRTAARDVGLPQSAPEALLRNWDGLAPWPEAPAVLQRLRAQGYMLGVVTNCSKELGHRAASRASQSSIDFDAVVTAEESGFYKPASQAYQAILTAMAVDARDVLFVAGSAGDVQGATKAGMRVVWHNKVGMAKAGNIEPLREGRTLDDALKSFL
ncbi:haloacid dehalogenase, type II [Exophiala aquamarina CBS 119918]|uniref:Haloacid dehalogenase, type II n=1 Tax=Exophiala aquamarina CBS 119918 TaxID=1182545 RepID=A0A072P7F8_9EURO|nr:haloacid dehalogenase, type II [Exophiala aquamarina CBS 119918]KEF51545.1 haloacid dehalogenase, type II [Exophiala aquamarina CBS 119918]